MTDDDLVWLSVIDLGRRIRTREITATRVAQAFLDRIAALNPRLEAFVTVPAERALAEAAAADAEIEKGFWRGPLHGVPYCLKDIVQTAGVRTTAGSYILADWVPDVDACVQKRLAAAGGVLLGKVNTHEFAFGATTQNVHGKTRNPHDLSRIPGGSSGGSGAAVAAALAPFSIGSDTAGSIRLPSAYCGIAGFKPTWGLVSTAGVVAQSFTSDHVGPMARSVQDLAAVMAAIAGPDPDDPTCLATSPPDFRAVGPALLDGIRVGIPQELMRIPLEPAVQAGFARACAALEMLGAMIQDVSVPLLLRASDINNAIVPPETMAQHARWQETWFRGREIRYGADVGALLAKGAAVPGTTTILAQRDRVELSHQIRTLFACSIDILLTPTVPMTAVQDGAIDLGAMIHFLCPFSLAGVPALALPCGADANGLPVSVQVVGPHLHDLRVLAVGCALQSVLERPARPSV